MTIQSFEIISTDPQLYVVITNDEGSTWGQIIELPRNVTAENDVKEYVWKFIERRATEMAEHDTPPPIRQPLLQVRETVSERQARLPRQEVESEAIQSIQ